MKKKIWANLQRIIGLPTQKLSLSSQKWVWDPGSGKNLFRIPDPGVKKAPDPGSGSATLLTDMFKMDKVIHFQVSEPYEKSRGFSLHYLALTR